MFDTCTSLSLRFCPPDVALSLLLWEFCPPDVAISLFVSDCSSEVTFCCETNCWNRGNNFSTCVETVSTEFLTLEMSSLNSVYTVSDIPVVACILSTSLLELKEVFRLDLPVDFFLLPVDLDFSCFSRFAFLSVRRCRLGRNWIFICRIHSRD